MPAISIQIKGLDTLIRNAGRAAGSVTKEIDRVIKTSIFDLEKEIKPITPIDTGRLRSGFIRSFQPLRGTLDNPVEYAEFVHEGTERWPLSMPPRNPNTVRQFMIEGTEKAEEKIMKNFEDIGEIITDILSNRK